MSEHFQEREVVVAGESARLEGNLTIPTGAQGIVLFAHGSGSSRHSPRNRFVAQVLNKGGLATLLIDLLTADEDMRDRLTREHRFDIDLLARRLLGAAQWLKEQPQTRDLSIGLFGASTGAGAALVAAAHRPDDIQAVVSRGGRPDLAGDALNRVRAPTLLIVGGQDIPVIGLNQQALAEIPASKKLEIVPGATHLFEEPGTLEAAAELARNWFVRWLTPAQARHVSTQT